MRFFFLLQKVCYIFPTTSANVIIDSLDNNTGINQKVRNRGRELMVRTTIYSMSVSFLIGLAEWVLFLKTDLSRRFYEFYR